MDLEDRARSAAVADRRASLAIGCLPWVCRTRLADLLVAFGQVAPAVDVGVQELPRAALLPALAAGELDVAVMPTRPLTDRPSKPLWRDQAMLAVARDHPLADMAEMAPAALMDETFLISRQDQGADMHRFLAERIGAPDDLRARLCDAGLPRLLEQVAAGAAVALVPAHTLVNTGVKLIPFAGRRGRFTVRDYWRDVAPDWPLSALIGLPNLT